MSLAGEKRVCPFMKAENISGHNYEMVPTTGFEPAMGLLRRITNPFHSTSSGKSA